MIKIQPLPFFRHEKQKKTPPMPTLLTLVSANWVPDDSYLFLEFDRAVDIAAINPTVIVVEDGGSLMYQLQGDPAGASLLDANTVRLTMEAVDPFYGSGVSLTAPGDTGIVAVDDGTAWAGVTNVSLPFA